MEEKQEARARAVATAYDVLAESYAQELFDELRNKPLDRALLAAFAEQVKQITAASGPQDGLVLEVGCGPGQIARHLSDLGVRVVGVDLSKEMVAEAKRRSPAIEFRRGNMLALDAPDGRFAGVVAFYAIVHLEREEVATAFREVHRVLKPGGLALVSFHLGDERLRPGELWAKKIDLEWIFLPSAFVENALSDAGFSVEARLERAPYVGAEHPSRRAYLLARKPAEHTAAEALRNA